MLGCSAFFLIACGLAGWTGLIGLEPGGGLHTLSIVMWRAGLTVGAMWLAFPQLADFFTRFPPVLVGTFALGLAVAAWRPKTLTIVLPALLLLTLLHFSGFLLRKR
jgi:hypothetical protein